MKKRKAVRETKNIVQTALWLPRDMHEKLKEAGGERGLGEEIRRRLEAAFDAAATPRMGTVAVRDQIEVISEMFRATAGHDSIFACDVVRAAIDALLSSHQSSRRRSKT